MALDFCTLCNTLLLTILPKVVTYLLLQLNDHPIVPGRGALPMDAVRGIITLTLVIGRTQPHQEFKGSTVKRGAFVVWNLFNVKTKLQTQLEEYVAHKAKTSPFIAEDQRAILMAFIAHTQQKTLLDITPKMVEEYYTHIRGTMTHFTTIKAMQAIRAFIRHHKTSTQIKPFEITDTGVEASKPPLPDVGESVIVPPMTRPKMGRPMNMPLVLKVKRLKDVEKLSFRAISRAVKKDVKNVYQMYNYPIS